MKKILCTTDFSRSASKVCKYAVQLAAQTNARLYILHASHPAYTYTPDVPAMVFEDTTVRSYHEDKLKRLAKRLQKLSNGNVAVEALNKDGFAVDVITETAGDLKPDLLIMSTVGQLPKSSELFGNVSSAMVLKSPVPLLFVPPKAEFKSFENVYLAADVSEKMDAVALQQLIDLLKPFSTVITIFSVVKDPEDAEVREGTVKLREMLGEHPHVIDVHKGENFVSAFLEGARANKADMLVVFPKEHGWFERWWRLSNTEELMFRTNLPLVAIS